MRSFISVPTGSGHFTYMHHDVSGRVLYVGYTANPMGRVANHQASSSGRSGWWSDVVRISWFEHATEADGLAHERLLVRTYRPPYNVQFRAGVTPRHARAQIVRRLSHRHRLAEVKAATSTKIDPRTLRPGAAALAAIADLGRAA